MADTTTNIKEPVIGTNGIVATPNSPQSYPKVAFPTPISVPPSFPMSDPIKSMIAALQLVPTGQNTPAAPSAVLSPNTQPIPVSPADIKAQGITVPIGQPAPIKREFDKVDVNGVILHRPVGMPETTIPETVNVKEPVKPIVDSPKSNKPVETIVTPAAQAVGVPTPPVTASSVPPKPAATTGVTIKPVKTGREIQQHPERYKKTPEGWVVNAGPQNTTIQLVSATRPKLYEVLKADGVIIRIADTYLISPKTAKTIRDSGNPHYDVIGNGSALGVDVGKSIPIIDLDISKLTQLGSKRDESNSYTAVADVTYIYETEEVVPGIPRGLVDQINYTLVENIERPEDEFDIWNIVYDADYSITKLRADTRQPGGANVDYKKLATFIGGVTAKANLLRSDFNSIKDLYYNGKIPTTARGRVHFKKRALMIDNDADSNRKHNTTFTNTPQLAVPSTDPFHPNQTPEERAALAASASLAVSASAAAEAQRIVSASLAASESVRRAIIAESASLAVTQSGWYTRWDGYGFTPEEKIWLWRKAITGSLMSLPNSQTELNPPGAPSLNWNNRLQLAATGYDPKRGYRFNGMVTLPDGDWYGRIPDKALFFKQLPDYDSGANIIHFDNLTEFPKLLHPSLTDPVRASYNTQIWFANRGHESDWGPDKMSEIVRRLGLTDFNSIRGRYVGRDQWGERPLNAWFWETNIKKRASVLSLAKRIYDLEYAKGYRLPGVAPVSGSNTGSFDIAYTTSAKQLSQDQMIAKWQAYDFTNSEKETLKQPVKTTIGGWAMVQAAPFNVALNGGRGVNINVRWDPDVVRKGRIYEPMPMEYQRNAFGSGFQAGDVTKLTDLYGVPPTGGGFGQTENRDKYFIEKNNVRKAELLALGADIRILELSTGIYY